MEKQKLNGFISRYNLGGEVESVMVTSTDDSVSVKMISDEKTLLGDVMYLKKISQQVSLVSTLLLS